MATPWSCGGAGRARRAEEVARGGGAARQARALAGGRRVRRSSPPKTCRRSALAHCLTGHTTVVRRGCLSAPSTRGMIWRTTPPAQAVPCPLGVAGLGVGCCCVVCGSHSRCALAWHECVYHARRHAPGSYLFGCVLLSSVPVACSRMSIMRSVTYLVR